jgi:hypothetical protein
VFKPHGNRAPIGDGAPEPVEEVGATSAGAPFGVTPLECWIGEPGFKPDDGCSEEGADVEKWREISP